MRRVNQTTVNVVVTDRFDRTNVVRTLRVALQRLRFCLRKAGFAHALAKRIAEPGFGTMLPVPAGSPSWGGHRLSGGPGYSSRS